MKWSDVKRIRSEEELDYFQEKGQKGDKWSERNLKCRKIKSAYIQGEVWESVKWNEVKGIWNTEEIEYLQEHGLESDKWSEMKWSEVNGREFEVGWRSAKCGEGKGIKAG